jgi:integrase
MGAVFKKSVTKAVPRGAEIITRQGQRYARWKDRRGKTRTAPLTTGQDGSDRIVIESSRYIAKYRDASGVVREVPTGCRDETAARQVLAELERKAELVRSGVMTASQAAVSNHQAGRLEEHFEAFDEHLKAKGVTKIHREDTGRYLRRLADECPFSTLADLRREALERWLATRTDEGMSARTRNAYRNAAASFCNWCVVTDRLATNPFDDVPKANEKADPRRQRRAMTEAELTRLLEVARSRPLLDTMTVRKGPRKGERYANLRPETRDRLEFLGKGRALIYKTLVLTGLRQNELASLTVAQLQLDDAVPHAVLDAADEKNREGNVIPLRDDLAADLRAWLAEKLARLQAEAGRLGEPVPARLPPDSLVFVVPAQLYRILDRDLKMAGIPKRDDRGRTLDVHALRHTFGTLLSKGGVSPRTAQAAMRHQDIKLTMNVYTDPKLLDVRAALDTLPALPLEGTGVPGPLPAVVTGTEGPARKFAPGFAPTGDNLVQTEASPVKAAGQHAGGDWPAGVGVSSSPVKRKEPLTAGVSGSLVSGRLDSNQRPPEPHSGGRTLASTLNSSGRGAYVVL